MRRHSSQASAATLGSGSETTWRNERHASCGTFISISSLSALRRYLLDQSPGAAGHQQVFALVSGFALLGLIASYLFACITRAAD
jgi:hypothetical protein